MMHVNILNMEQIVTDVTKTLKEFNDPIVMWAQGMLRDELSGENWRARAATLDIPFKQVIRGREFRLMKIMEERGVVLDRDYRSRTTAIYQTDFLILSDEEVQKVPWLERAMADGDDIVAYGEFNRYWHPGYKKTENHFKPRHDQNNVVHHLCEALRYFRPDAKEHSKISMARAFEYAEERQRILDKQAKETEGEVKDMGPFAYVHEGATEEEFKDGYVYRIWELLDQQATLREGFLMHHCVGNYTPTPERRFFSIRNQEGVSIATAEIQKEFEAWRIIQVQGPSNEDPGSALKDHFQTFVTSNIGPIYEVKFQSPYRGFGGVGVVAHPMDDGYYLANGPIFRGDVVFHGHDGMVRGTPHGPPDGTMVLRDGKVSVWSEERRQFLEVASASTAFCSPNPMLSAGALTIPSPSEVTVTVNNEVTFQGEAAGRVLTGINELEGRL